MRKFLTSVIAGITLLVTALPALATTMAAWGGSPITLGDKTFTLISTTWADNDEVFISSFASYYICDVKPAGSPALLTNTTRTLVYKVTIIDDPGTSLNELLTMYLSSVSADGNRYVASGTLTVTGIFDDDSDFSSPLATFSNSGTPTGVLAIAGEPLQIYVKITMTAAGSTILTDHAVSFLQMEHPVAVESSTWGKIKSLYR